jgi:tetratricopeptide (TPR) repeat protein
MKTRAFGASVFLFFAIAAAVFSAPSAWADGDSEKASEETFAAYMAMLRADPSSDEANLGLARAAMASGRFHHAIMAYERMLAKYPGDDSLWRDLADAYRAAGDEETARWCLARADGAGAAESAGRNAPRFRKTVRLRAGVYYDSNANQGPESDEARIGSIKIRLRDADEVETAGLYLGGRIDATYRLSEAGPWFATAGASANLRYGFDGALRKIDRTFSQWYAAYAGVRRAAGTNIFDFALTGEIFDYDFYDTIYSYGAEAAFVHAARPRLHLITRAGVSDRRYARSPSQNGVYGYAGQYFRFIFGAKGHEFTIGARYVAADAESSAYSYSGPEYSARFNFRVNDRLEISPGIVYAVERYDAPGAFWENHDRRDERLTLSLGLTRRLNETTAAEFAYQYSDLSSDSAFRSYDRHNASLGLVWTF